MVIYIISGLWIVLGAIGLALDIIVVPIAAVIGIPLFIGITIHGKWKAHKEANERLKRIKQGGKVYAGADD